MRLVRYSIAMLLVLALAACSSAPPPPPAPAPAPAAAAAATPAPAPVPAGSIAATADDANAPKVCIYRMKQFVGFALHPTVMLDGKDLINVSNGTAWTGTFKPGHYLFQMDDKKSGAALDLKPGETYYFRVDIVPGFWKGGGRMTLMAKEQGTLESKDLPALPVAEIEHPDFKLSK